MDRSEITYPQTTLNELWGAQIKAILALEAGGKPLQSTKRYKVAGWAPVAEGITGEPIWDVVARYLRTTGTVPPLQALQPRLAGTNPSPNVS